jgi:hypothetical protein
MKWARITKAEFEIHENFVIVRFDEGSNFTLEDWKEIKKVLLDNFSGKFAWISDRINSFSVDPTLLLDTEVIEDMNNFVCVAQVNYEKKVKDSTDLAKDFFPANVPFRSFTKLEDALNWVKEKLRDIGT